MIESIEGKRGEPRLRPPYVAQVGLFGRPTLEHNMETLHWVREIVEKGPAWFAGHGRNGRKGLRSFSVSGRVKKPGVHLAPAGITLQELIDEYCGGMLDGHTLYGYLPGGASGGILPASMANVPLDFDTLTPYGCFIGSAAIVVLSDKDTATAAARNVMKFFADESCGQCTPCRVGTEKALHLMNERAVGPAAAEGAVAGDDGRLDLRAGSGGAEPGAVGAEVFPEAEVDMMHQNDTYLRLDVARWSRSRSTGRRVVGPRRSDDPPDGGRPRHRGSAPLLHGGHARGRQLPHVHGRDQGRARARAVLLPLSEGRHGGHDRTARAPSPARRCRSSCCCRTSRRRPTR